MTELERLQLALERQYDARPVAQFGALFIGSRDYLRFDAWAARLETLRHELIDLSQGHLSCHHPAGATSPHPVTGNLYCALCGKDLK